MSVRRNGSDTAATILIQERNVKGVPRLQALVLKRGITAPWKPNYWNFPGGGIDAGETAEDAARRECEEEISLSPTDLRYLTTWNDPEGWALDAFVATKWKGEPVVTWESDGYAWISQDDLPHMRFVPSVRELLEQVFRAAR